MPLVLGGSSAVAEAYSIDNSLRFNSGDSPSLVQTPTAGDPDKWTYSIWFKRSKLSSTTYLLTCVDGSNDVSIALNSSDVLFWTEYPGSIAGKLQTNRVFKDVSSWYHIVFTWDSANGVAGNRMRIYVNGVEETSFSVDTNPSSGQDSVMGTAYPVAIGTYNTGSNFFGGYFAEVAYCNGQAYGPTDFGEFNAASPTIWQPKDLSGLTFGTGGFWLDFEDAANLGADVSGQGNDFTEANLTTLDQTPDTPTNNFATANPLMSNAEGFAEGNLYVTDRASTDASYGACSSMGARKGKWYMEMYMVSTGSSINLGAMPETSSMTTAGDYQYQTNNFMYRSTDGNKFIGTGTGDDGGGSYGATYTTGDIISIALDMDNQDIYFYKNGTIQDSGTAAFTSSDFVDDTFYFFYQAGYNTGIVEYNFGNPVRTISSGNADANGYGNFEYAVPSGYYALCSKNLGEFGG